MFKLIIFLMLFCFTLSAEEFTTYSNLKDGFSIAYPASWSKAENQDILDLVLASPKNATGGSSATVNIIVQDIPKEVDQATYYTSNLKNLLDTNATVRLQDSCSAELAGREVKVLRYTMDYGTTRVQIVQYLFTVGQRGYVVTTGGAEAQFAENKDLLEKIAKSFKLVEQPALQESSKGM